MHVRIFIVLVVLILLKWTCSLTTSISGEISEDLTFIYKTFPVPPSKRAIIEYDVHYQIYGNYFPGLGIYTTENHINIKKQCTYLEYGQLGNKNMHPKIRITRIHRCIWENSDGKVHCIGNVTVQDFKPRNFSFSFGFSCKEITALSSLKGLVYSFSIHKQTNETNCMWVPYNSVHACQQYYQYTALPNLIGGEDMQTVLRDYETFKGYVVILYVIGSCYKHLEQLACHLLVPKCDPESRQVIHPCREMCHDFRTACSKITLPKNTLLTDKVPHVHSGENIVVDTSLEFDCDYLPSLNGDIPCLYKPVTCKSPPVVKNAVVSNVSMNYNNYSVLDEVYYSCNEGYETEDNKKISCLYSGEWSTPPKCSLPSKSASPLVIVVPVLLFPLLILFATIIFRKTFKFGEKIQSDLHIYNQVELDTILMEIKGIDKPILSLKRKLDSKRNSFFDAFVLYHFDSNDSFVVNHLVPELEDKRKFRLFIHSRNFIPGHDIKQNIEDAIEGSNSAIIVMSQGFVDSMWCKEEFTHCYIENMKDAAFNLFVIMMQTADTLVNLSNYMKTFFANKTYLDVNDPELFTKLAAHLKKIKHPENDGGHDADKNNDSDDD